MRTEPWGSFVDPDGEKSMAELLAERQVAGMSVDLQAMATVSNIHRVAMRIRHHFEQGILREYDLTWTSFVALWVLWIWGETQTRWLAEEVGISRSTLSGVLNTLQSRDLVSRRTHESEGRLVIVSITDQGMAVLDGLFPRFNAEESFVVSSLSEDAKRRLASALRTIQDLLDTEGPAWRDRIAGGGRS